MENKQLESGSVLVVILLVLGLISMLALGVSQSTRLQSLAVRSIEDFEQARVVSELACQKASKQLYEYSKTNRLADEGSRKWSTLLSFELDGYQSEVRIVSGKIKSYHSAGIVNQFQQYLASADSLRHVRHVEIQCESHSKENWAISATVSQDYLVVL